MILIAAVSVAIPRIASAQIDEPNLLLISASGDLSVKHDPAYHALRRDERVKKDLQQVIQLASHTLNSDEHRLHEIREEMARDSSKNLTGEQIAAQEEKAVLEQSVSVLKGCLAAEQELAVEDNRDIRLDRQQLKLDERA
jgi:predicted GNAT family acetyltransferase